MFSRTFWFLPGGEQRKQLRSNLLTVNVHFRSFLLGFLCFPVLKTSKWSTTTKNKEENKITLDPFLDIETFVFPSYIDT